MGADKKFMLITLGEELLLGLTQNTHLTYLGTQLQRKGITLHSHYTISDEFDEIVAQVSSCWERADVLIITGGLGPTVDDRTKEAVASSIGETLIFDESVLAAIEERFKSLKLQMTDNNRKQAYRPRSAEVLDNPNGTAPGLWVQKDDKILVMLPGPPFELKPMFENLVLPRLEELELISHSEPYLQLRTIGIGESKLETLLAPTFEKYEDLNIAYCAHSGQVDLRISFAEMELRQDELIDIAQECKDLLGDNFLCYGHDTVASVVSNILKSRSKTLATAESCTGGLISNTFTDLSGSSEFFLGAIVSYSVDAKFDLLGVPEEIVQQHSPVSREVALAMVDGAADKFESDYAISTTGYAGPTGGTEDTPVGTAFIGLHTPSGNKVRRVYWKAPRDIIKKRVLNTALDMLRRELISEGDDEDDLNTERLREEARNILKSLS